MTIRNISISSDCDQHCPADIVIVSDSMSALKSLSRLSMTGSKIVKIGQKITSSASLAAETLTQGKE